MVFSELFVCVESKVLLRKPMNGLKDGIVSVVQVYKTRIF
jgi:hypothetical protein